LPVFLEIIGNAFALCIFRNEQQCFLMPIIPSFAGDLFGVIDWAQAKLVEIFFLQPWNMV